MFADCSQSVQRITYQETQRTQKLIIIKNTLIICIVVLEINTSVNHRLISFEVKNSRI